MGSAIISRRNKKSDVDVIENNGRYWEKSYSGHYLSMPTKANGVWVLRSADYANPIGLLYSTDGITWTQSNVTEGAYYKLINANGLWVAAGNSGTGIYYSTDGMTWEQGNITGGSFSLLAYENGLWVTGGVASGFWYSFDGKTWMQSNFTSSESSIGQLKYGGGTWVVTSASHSSSWGTYYSTDGKTWTQSNATPGTCDFLEYHNGAWVMSYSTNSAIWGSTDGKVWTQCSDEANKVGSGDIVFGNGVWVGTCANYSNSTQTGFWYSTNGLDWVQSNITSGSSQDLIYANGVWLCRSSDDGSFYSADGKTWESLDINTYAPSYVNGLWICSSGSYVCYSEDGKTWTQTGCPCLAMGQTSCANGVWLRTGYTIMPKDATGIGVFYSTDGKNWNQADFPLVEQYERIEFNPTSIKNEDGLWVMLDQYEGLYYSTLTRQISKSA